MNKSYWYVYGGTKRGPTFRHESETSALVEAKRLCDLYGGSWEVLKAVVRISPCDRYQVERLTESIPF